MNIITIIAINNSNLQYISIEPNKQITLDFSVAYKSQIWTNISI